MPPSREAKMKEILAQLPFRYVTGSILKIVTVESLYGPSARSGNVFKVFTSDGRIYKLHYADSWLDAKKIEKRVKKFPNIFPKFYGREGRYLLFDWIEGRELTKKEDLIVYKKLGQMCADVHKAKVSADKYEEWDVEKYFTKRLNKIPDELLSEGSKAKIYAKYKELKEKIKFDVVLEITDIHTKNFMIDKKENVYLVDEEGMYHRIKGLGFIKPFLKWFNEEQKKAFLEGYNEIHPIDFFDKDYETLVTIIECVRQISYGIQENYPLENYAVHLKTIKEICGL